MHNSIIICYLYCGYSALHSYIQSPFSIISNDLTLNSNNKIAQPEISIFPVPTHYYLNIRHLGESKLRKLILFDLDGKKVIEKTHLANEMQLDLSFLQYGTYILMIDTNEKHIVHKVVKIGTNN